VAWYHAQGIKVVPWTVDDPEEMRRMAECRVDATIAKQNTKRALRITIYKDRLFPQSK